MIFPADVYEYITNFADDITILNMLSVNKRFNSEAYFGRIMNKKYPLLIRFKKHGDTYRTLFQRMSYYINKIEEKWGIPYIPCQNYNPEEVIKNKPINVRHFLRLAIISQDVKIINLVLSKGAKITHASLVSASQMGNLNLFKYFLEKLPDADLESSFHSALHEGHLEIVKFILEDKKSSIVFDDYTLGRIIHNDNIEIVKYMMDKYSFDRSTMINMAIDSNKTNIIKFLSNIRSIDVDYEYMLEISSQNGNREIINFALDRGAKDLESAIHSDACASIIEDLVIFKLIRDGHLEKNPYL